MSLKQHKKITSFLSYQKNICVIQDNNVLKKLNSTSGMIKMNKNIQLSSVQISIQMKLFLLIAG